MALAAWNRSANLLLEDLGITVFSPAELTPERARALQRSFTALGAQLSAALTALSAMDALLPKLIEAAGEANVRKCAETAAVLVSAIQAQVPWLEANALPEAALADSRRACEAALERRDILRAIDGDGELKRLIGNHFAGIDTRIDEVLESLSFGQSLERYRLPDQIVSNLKADHPLEAAQRIATVLTQVLEGLQKVRAFASSQGTCA